MIGRARVENFPEHMTQRAPYPLALVSLVARLTYKPNWTFELKHKWRDTKCEGLTLDITVREADSYGRFTGPGTLDFLHVIEVPAASYDYRAWQRWLFDRIVEVETHEAMEWFKIDGRRPYAPHHGPGRNPYVIHEIGTTDEASTSSTGVVGSVVP
jgi:hypothetical protein